MTNTQPNNNASREYRPAPWTRLLLLVGVGLFVFVPIVLVINQAPWYQLMCVVPVFGLLAWLALIQATQMCLVVREDGLEYRFGSGSLIAPWDNMQRFMVRPASRYTTITGIELKTSVKQQVTGGRMQQMMFGGAEREDFIPVSNVVRVLTQHDRQAKKWSVNTEQFAQTPLGQDLLHFAPQLFEDKVRH